jgi:MFS family permease
MTITDNTVSLPQRIVVIFECLLLTYYGIATGFSFGLPLPTMSHYITGSISEGGLHGSITDYSWTVTAFSIGELVGSFSLAPLQSKIGLYAAILLSKLIALAGALMYYGGKNVHTIALARVMLGLWSGTINVSMRTHFKEIVPHERLAEAMNGSAFLVVIAMAISPGFASIVEKVQLDIYRGPGLILSIFILLGILLHLGYFWGNRNAFIIQSPADDAAGRTQERQHLLPAPRDETFENMWGLKAPVAIALLSCFFVSSVGFTMLEAMAVPIMSNQYGMDVSESGSLFMIAGLASALAFVLMFFINRHKLLSVYVQTLLTLAMMFASYLLLTSFESFGPQDPCQQFSCSFDVKSSCPPISSVDMCVAQSQCVWNPTFRKGSTGSVCTTCPPVCMNPNFTFSYSRMMVGFTGVNVGFVTGRVASATLYSILLKGRRKTIMQAVLVSTGSIARIAAPVVSIAIYQVSSFQTYGIMLLMAGATFLSILLMLMLRNHLNDKKTSASGQEIVVAD